MLTSGLSGNIQESDGSYWITSGSGNETKNMTMLDGNLFTTYGELLLGVEVSSGGGNSGSNPRSTKCSLLFDGL
jgi:hypothetical protein